MRPHRSRRTWRKSLRLRFQLLQSLRHTPLELRIAAVEDRLDVVLHHDVGIYAVPFDDPLAFERHRGELGDEDLAAVDHRTVEGDAHDTAPGAGADQRS